MPMKSNLGGAAGPDGNKFASANFRVNNWTLRVFIIMIVPNKVVSNAND